MGTKSRPDGITAQVPVAFVEMADGTLSPVLCLLGDIDSNGIGMPPDFHETGATTSGTTTVLSGTGTIAGAIVNYTKTFTGVGTSAVIIGQWVRG